MDLAGETVLVPPLEDQGRQYKDGVSRVMKTLTMLLEAVEVSLTTNRDCDFPGAGGYLFVA